MDNRSDHFGDFDPLTHSRAGSYEGGSEEIARAGGKYPHRNARMNVMRYVALYPCCSSPPTERANLGSRERRTTNELRDAGQIDGGRVFG